MKAHKYEVSNSFSEHCPTQGPSFLISSLWPSAGDVNEAIELYKSAIKITVESTYMAPDDKLVEKMRTDLAELLHIAGRYDHCVNDLVIYFSSS